MGYETYYNGELIVSPPLTPEHMAEINVFAGERHEPPTYPGYWCGWIATATDRIQAESGKNYDTIEWLQYVVDEYLVPRGYTLNGDVFWDGEESDDKGVIRVRRNTISEHPAVTTYPGGPDYDPTPTARTMWPA